MIDTLVLVLVGIGVYSGVAMAAQRWGYLPAFIEVAGPITTVHTQRGRVVLNWLARHRRFWRALTNVGIGMSLLVLVGTFLATIFSGMMSVQQPESSPVQGPSDAVVVPGVNDFLPLSATPEIVFGLVVGLIVHEGGHGLLCRVEDIDIDSMGVGLFTIVPIGAFVQPDEESQRAADRGAKTRMFVAGATNNILLTIFAILLLFGPVAGSIHPVDGVAVGGVDPGSPADTAGIEVGDVLTEINGTQATVKDRGTVDVDSWVYVHRATDNGPFDLAANDTVVAINDTPISREADLHAALETQTTATIRTADGREVTAPIGAYAAVQDGGPLATAGAPAGAPILVTRLGGERIHNASDVFTAVEAAEPGSSIEVDALLNGSHQQYTVKLGSRDDSDGAVLGVRNIQPGYSGVAVSELGIRRYPTQRTLGLLGGDTDAVLDMNILEHTLLLLVLPAMAMIDPSAFGFTGFTGPITNFYTISGPLGFLGGGVFILANLLFWTIWINLNVGLFNLIPLYPLDGGHILRTSAEAIVARTRFNSRWAVRAVTVSVGLVMFSSLLVMIFGPMVLS